MNYEKWIDILEDPQALLQNLQFVLPVEIDIEKFDKAWFQDKVYYIPPRSPTCSQRKLQFVEFLRGGQPIIMPEIRLLNGIPDFINGRHRYSVLRDLGLKRMPVVVDETQLAEFRLLFS